MQFHISTSENQLFDADRLAVLESAVEHQLGREVRQLRITLHAGGLVLSGRTSTYRAKQQIQQLVTLATALPIIVDGIEIG